MSTNSLAAYQQLFNLLLKFGFSNPLYDNPEQYIYDLLKKSPTLVYKFLEDHDPGVTMKNNYPIHVQFRPASLIPSFLEQHRDEFWTLLQQADSDVKKYINFDIIPKQTPIPDEEFIAMCQGWEEYIILTENNMEVFSTIENLGSIASWIVSDSNEHCKLSKRLWEQFRCHIMYDFDNININLNDFQVELTKLLCKVILQSLYPVKHHI